MMSPTLRDLADQYIQYGVIIRNYTPETASNYKTTLKVFTDDIQAEYPKELTLKKIEAFFFNGRIKRKWGTVTYRSYIKNLNTFFKWLVKEEYLQENLISKVEKPRLEQKIPRTLTREQALRLLEYSFNMSYPYRLCKYRNRAIIAIMLMAGLRRKEVVSLKLNEVSLEEGSLFINQGKGGKDRIIPINSKLKLILSKYLEQRTKHNKKCTNFFVSIQGDEPLGKSGLKKLIEMLRKKTKMDFSAHTLRHAFARLMLEGGCDIYTLSKLMGHSKITTTTIYLSCSNQQMTKSVEMHVLN